MAVKTAAGYRCGGRSKTHTTYGNAVLILQPTGGALALSGGWGQYIRTQARNANTVPAFRRSLTRAQRAPIPVAPAFTNHPAATRVQPHGLAVGKLPATNRHDMASPCAPDRPPWFGRVFRVPPATVPPITSKLIYINARASAARFTHNVSKQGSSPARPRPRQVVAMRDGCQQGRCGAGDWCRGWPRPFRAGCGVPGGGAGCRPRA